MVNHTTEIHMPHWRLIYSENNAKDMQNNETIFFIIIS